MVNFVECWQSPDTFCRRHHLSVDLGGWYPHALAAE